jgi:DNA-binding MarR family transcriptional regulator
MCPCVRYVKVYVLAVGEAAADARPDLAAMLSRLTRALIEVERPILAAHELSMWGYVVLTALRDEPMRTQAALARAIGADKTRIIGVLDELQERGLIEREPDPDDRRMRLLRLTPPGRRLHTSVQRAIRGAEQRLLDRLPATDRATFLQVLRTLDEDPATRNR